MGLPKTYSTGGNARGLPVDGTIDFASFASEDPVGAFPPLAVRTRMDRLAWFWELFNGDFTDLALRPQRQGGDQTKPVFTEYGTNQFTTQTNPFRSVATTIADLLLMDPPEFTDPKTGVNAVAALYDIITHQVVYGAAVAMATDDPANPVDVLEPMWWVPSIDGWWYLTPVANLEGNYEDCTILSWSNTDSTLTKSEHTFGGTFWSDIGTGKPMWSDKLDEDPVRVIPRSPRRHGEYGYRWGTSVFDDICSPIAEINKRLSDNSYALGRQSRPSMTYRIADADRADIAPDVTPTTPFDESVDELALALGEYDEHNNWALSDAIQAVDAVVWDGQIAEASIQIEMMQQAIEAAASIPGLFSGLMLEGALSGVALKRIMLRLYANTLHTQKSTEVSFNELLVMAGCETPEWRNALAAMDEASDDPEAHNEDTMMGE